MSWVSRSRTFGCALAASTVLSGAPALAQPAPATVPTTAPAPTTPFDEATALMRRDQYEQAIPKLEESLARDRSVGALFNLGVCFEKLNKTASAYARFKAAETFAHDRRDPREADAQLRASALESRLSKVTISVPPDVDDPNLEVKRDGDTVPRAEWGLPAPVDPGPHTITATSPGKEPWSAQFSALPSGGDWSSIVVGPFRALDEIAPRSPMANAPERPAPTGLGVQRIGALAAAGTGVGLIVVGSIFGLGAGAKFDDSKTHCNPNDPNACDATGVSLRDDARSAGTISTVTFVLGGVALAAGAVLWFTAPSRSTSAAVGLGPSGVTWKAAW
ncbi:MAG: hypothetical protein JWM74_3770 [Myxococcaceae bacterium]|nr:hypothetical protein [Myxococcaceae bacterium]